MITIGHGQQLRIILCLQGGSLFHSSCSARLVFNFTHEYMPSLSESLSLCRSTLLKTVTRPFFALSVQFLLSTALPAEPRSPLPSTISEPATSAHLPSPGKMEWETETWKHEPPYVRQEGFEARYTARCLCGLVVYQVKEDPVDSKICHCTGCQVAHGAPMQWASIFHKTDVQFLSGIDCLEFYSAEEMKRGHVLPCKVKCKECHTLIADEGRRMWLAFPSLFGFSSRTTPQAFKPTCHIFYGQRVFNFPDDGVPKYIGHKGKSPLYEPQKESR
mmetsp:Transcript_9929/g.19257  ORF Transcript_9929/g.19257 Transcript_9929/m.19257 type:complete len:274 (-) Transcript_9929:65-886(-)